MPKPLNEQIEEFLAKVASEGYERSEASKLKAGAPNKEFAISNHKAVVPHLGSQAKDYITSKHLADIKQITSDTDVVSALVHTCKTCFQLEPYFEFKENNKDQSRFKFTASVKFHGTLIGSSSGQNKQEAKKNAAKVALKKVAPNIY